MSRSSVSTSEAAAAIIELINSSPRSPRIEEIAAIVARAVSSPGADDQGDDEVAVNCAGKPIACLADIDFEPVVGADGKPIEFDYTNTAFADAFCPTIRMAFTVLGKDKAGVCEFARGITEDDPNCDLLMNLLENWHILENKFAAISKFAQMAQAHVMLVGELMDATEKGLTHGPSNCCRAATR